MEVKVRNQATTLTKEQVQLPPVYKEALERTIVDTFSLDDVDEALCSRYFRAEVVVCESENELRDDDKPQEDEYALQAVWFLAGWQARQRAEVRNEDIVKAAS
jgi:hypothetical protein